MSTSKAALKAISDAIRQHKFDAAIEQAQDFLQKEPRNYTALTFLGFALDKKDNLAEAEETYDTATKLRPADFTAWRGLVELYQKQGNRKLSAYQNATVRLAEIYRDSEDTSKCQEVVDNFITFARAHGSPLQYVDALSLILPESPVYFAVEGRTRPAETYGTIAMILEGHEKSQIDTLIGERRTRIGARVNEVTVEVKREVLGASRLAHISREIINWSHDDGLRRQSEEKLLQHCYERLLVLNPGPQKAEELRIVLQLAGDMVTIKHPFRLAWNINLNWRDFKETTEWGVSDLQDYCTFFPDTDLTRVLTAYLSSDMCPFPKLQPVDETSAQERGDNDESEDEDDGGAPTTAVSLSDEERLLMMSDGISTTTSLLAYRLVAEYYEHLQEYEANVEMIQKALALLQDQQTKTGMSFSNTKDVYNLRLATAYVFYQSPRHHQEAKALFEDILASDPMSTAAMIGVGLIYEEDEDYDEAVAFLDRALIKDPKNLFVRSEAAWARALKGDYAISAAELERCIPLIVAKGDGIKDLLAHTRYRLGVCIWNMDSSKSARKSRDSGSAYSYFLDALKSNLSFAPAYTSLGVYYADYARDKKRAMKCFQKAVELSPSEIISAERLARSFADDDDWDRVELVAQRVVHSGKVKPPPSSKKKGISWPFSALGVAELHKQEFHKAIVSFQSALRISPNDYYCWVGLGESYYSSGRYVAATKAIQNAQRLEQEFDENGSDEIWFTQFMMGNIKRELGEFDEAIALYQDAMQSRPNEEGVTTALLQTLVDSALDSFKKGLFGKSINLVKDTLSLAVVALEVMKDSFNFWKSIADSCAVFTSIQSRVTELPIDQIRILLGEGNDRLDGEFLLEIDGVDTTVVFAEGIFADDEKVGVDLTRAIHSTILAQKRAVRAATNDQHAQSVAFYNLGWAEQRAHECLPDTLKNQSSRYSKAAIRCFKRAIELEAGNADFWNALGVVTSQINPAVSQHAFVRSLHLDERNARVWTNLGTLGLLYNDAKLANEAFTRAQSADPDYAHAWLGQGFVALLVHDDIRAAIREARGLFTHAMEISESSSLIVREQYALSMFDHFLTAPQKVSMTSLIQVIFALGQLRGLNTQNVVYGHLSALFNERARDSEKSVAILEDLRSTLESDFELTGSAKSLKMLALASNDLARAYLATGSFDMAVRCGQRTLQLTSDNPGLSVDERGMARLSAHLTAGLAHYYKDDVSLAVAYLESALEESNRDLDVVCLLAQVLWATGSDEGRERARSVLFEVVSEQPDHVQSVLLLGVIALLDQDDESLEAVLSELESLRTNENVSAKAQFQIGEILQAVAAVSGDGAETAQLTSAQTEVMLYAHLPHGWSHLGDSAEGAEAAYPRALAVALATKGMPPKGQLEAKDLADAYAAIGRATDAQTSVMMAPWLGLGWRGLVDALAAS